MARSTPLVIAAYNEAMVQGIADAARPFLRPGDELDLVSGNQDHPASAPTVNRWCSELTPVVPPGTLFAVHTSGLDKVAVLADQVTPSVRSILLDYEPNFDPAFTWEFLPSLTHFDQFARLCRAKGRLAVAYPTGRAIQEGPLLRYGWDYAEISRHVDDLYPQTQHWASLGAPAWITAIRTLRGQYSRRGLDPRAIVVQLTIGEGGNAILAQPALERFREAAVDGIRRLYLWWSPPYLTELTKFLSGLER